MVHLEALTYYAYIYLRNLAPAHEMNVMRKYEGRIHAVMQSQEMDICMKILCIRVGRWCKEAFSRYGCTTVKSGKR